MLRVSVPIECGFVNLHFTLKVRANNLYSTAWAMMRVYFRLFRINTLVFNMSLFGWWRVLTVERLHRRRVLKVYICGRLLSRKRSHDNVPRNQISGCVSSILKWQIYVHFQFDCILYMSIMYCVATKQHAYTMSSYLVNWKINVVYVAHSKCSIVSYV
jgi:hypothetical protein